MLVFTFPYKLTVSLFPIFKVSQANSLLAVADQYKSARISSKALPNERSVLLTHPLTVFVFQKALTAVNAALQRTGLKELRQSLC